jgi:hypothetical protein
MTWFKVDDGFWRHRKVRLLGAEHKVAAVGCWTLSGDWSADNLTDGFVPAEIVADWDPTGVLTERLIAVGLWSKDTYDGETGIRYHDWHDSQPSKSDVLAERRYNKRKSALYRDPELLELVRKRDRERCRYCGTKVNWKDRRSPGGGVYDTVEHEDVNTLDNLVVCCRRCSSAKRDRPLSASGMTVLPPGSAGPPRTRSGPPPVDNQTVSSSYLDTNQIRTSDLPDPDPSRPDPSRPEVSTSSGDVENEGSTTAGAEKSAPSRKRGTRIPDDFRVTPAMVEWAREKAPHVHGPTETAKFRDYWTAKAGRDATKLDWPATWRVWMTTAEQQAGRGHGGNGNGPHRVATTTARVAAIEALRHPPGSDT